VTGPLTKMLDEIGLAARNWLAYVEVILGILGETRELGGLMNTTRGGLPHVTYVVSMSLPPDSYYLIPGAVEGLHSSYHTSSMRLSADAPRASREAAQQHSTWALPLAYISAPAAGNAGAPPSRSSGSSGWSCPGQGGPPLRCGSHVRVEIDGTSTPLDLPEPPPIRTVVAASSAAVGFMGSPSMMRAMLEQNLYRRVSATAFHCAPFGLAQLAVPTRRLCLANPKCGTTLENWACGEPIRPSWEPSELVPQVPSTLPISQCIGCSTVLSPLHDLDAQQCAHFQSRNVRHGTWAGTCCNVHECLGGGCAHGADEAKQATASLIDGTYTDNTGAAHLLARLQADCTRGASGQCTEPLRLIIQSADRPATKGRGGTTGGSQADVQSLFSTPCMRPEDAASCPPQLPRFPIAPGQPIPLATGALAATIPAPVVFDATFPSTANFTRTGSTVGDWTVYASQKELSARPTAAKDALDVSIFWHGKLRTMANPYYGTISGDDVDVLILLPMWNVPIIAAVEGTGLTDGLVQVARTHLAPLAAVQAESAVSVIQGWMARDV